MAARQGPVDGGRLHRALSGACGRGQGQWGVRGVMGELGLYKHATDCSF